MVDTAVRFDLCLQLYLRTYRYGIDYRVPPNATILHMVSTTSSSTTVSTEQ